MCFLSTFLITFHISSIQKCLNFYEIRTTDHSDQPSGIARPLGTHGQGTVRGPQSNGIILVGAPGHCPPACYAAGPDTSPKYATETIC